MYTHGMDYAAQRRLDLEYISLLEDQIEYNRLNAGLLIYNSFYDWQHRFNAATKEHIACLLMAANQVGKSRTGCAIDAFHLLGDYPDDWEGHTFDFPPLCWLLGFSGEKTRDLLQAKLFGQYHDGQLSGGWIPKERIIDCIPMNGTARAAREVQVQHSSGGISRCQFWSYSQGQHAIMGDVVDWYHIDEEPKDSTIYPQVVTRTLNGDQGRGGRGILTFTPENGKTELVKTFMDPDDEEAGTRYMQTATWDDAPHMTTEKKRKALAIYPTWQHAMRSRGVPLMGAGLIFEFAEEDIKCEPFEIPGHFKLINGMDFGWDHPWALVQLAIDEENDIIYVTHAFKKSKLEPHNAWRSTKAWCENIPVAWPQDGLQTRENGKEKRDMYIEEGFDLLDQHATWEGGGASVHTGIVQLSALLKTGRLRIFSHLHELFEEFRQYHTKKTGEHDENVHIVKINDDLLDALRYAYMMRREAIVKASLNDEDDYYDDYFHEDSNAMGY